MRKTIKKIRKYNLLFILIIILAFLFIAFIFLNDSKPSSIINKIILKDENLLLLFTGDIFLDRHIDELSYKSELKYRYPFSGLDTLEREKYSAWIGNLECPVTKEQSTAFQKENWLRFSCKEEYLPELRKFFDIVSLANNHTDNINGRDGLNETRKNLDKYNIKHFGDFDNIEKENLCKIIFIKSQNQKIPIAFCGYHGVYKLPKDDEIKVIEDYSKYFITIVMPHQGVEYEFKNNTYQKIIFNKFIDNGADAVIGSHPHVIQNVESYKGKLIFYSLGNFIFDQGWNKTREHMTVETEIIFPKYNNNYKELNCDNLSNIECLTLTKKLNITKPEFTLKYKPIFTNASVNFITKKKVLTEKEYSGALKTIGFDKIATSSKIQ